MHDRYIHRRGFRGTDDENARSPIMPTLIVDVDVDPPSTDRVGPGSLPPG